MGVNGASLRTEAVRLADVREASFSGYESACRYLCRILKRGLQAR